MNHASINNNIIQAIINGGYKFINRDKGMDFLGKLKDQFILAKNHEEMVKEGKVRLWIRGFKVTKEEEEKGGLGNYAYLELQEMPDGTSIIAVIKEEIEPNLHPVRKRKAARMPNYGHPTLRLAKKGTEFDRYEDAAEMLLNLHNEFPDTTIPNKDRVDLMIYSRDKTGGKPKTDKMRLSIKPAGEKFALVLEEKAAPKPKQKIPPQSQSGEPVQEGEERVMPQMPSPPSSSNGQILGKFTAMALMKKKKKK